MTLRCMARYCKESKHKKLYDTSKSKDGKAEKTEETEENGVTR